jgi:hypothetical protein
LWIMCAAINANTGQTSEAVGECVGDAEVHGSIQELVGAKF